MTYTIHRRLRIKRATKFIRHDDIYYPTRKDAIEAIAKAAQAQGLYEWKIEEVES